MAQVPEGYRDIPEEDRKKAQAFFDRARTVADTGNYEYGIELYLQGLDKDSDAIEAHQAMRDVALRRKANGGKPLGMFERMRLQRPTKDNKQNMLNAEKLLAYDPGNADHMLSVAQYAHLAGFYDTVLWIGPILLKANADSVKPPPDFQKFLALKDIYKDIRQYRRATEAAQYAAMLRPDEMDLQMELKNLGAMDTMDAGRYSEGGSFRASIRDMARQQELLDRDKDVRDMDVMQRNITLAESEFQADPKETGKLMKLVEALVRTERKDFEDRAIQLLDEAYQRTKQFRFRHNIGRIRLAQLRREEQNLRMELQSDPNDEELQKNYRQFQRSKAEQELAEYSLWAENYPTDMGFRYEMAQRLFVLGRYAEAIPVFQMARQDPKYRIIAGILLGRAFLEAGFVDESVDTLKACIDEYQARGDPRSKDMHYWYARGLEQKGDIQSALRNYSQVAQWDFNYRDVQTRIKQLRSRQT